MNIRNQTTRESATHRLLPLLPLVLLAGCAGPADEGSLFRRFPAGDLPGQGKTFGATFLDVDGDDRLDLLLSTHGNQAELFVIDRDNVFRRHHPAGGLPGGLRDQHGAAACDYDGDGDRDAYLTVGAHKGQGWSWNQLWRQRAPGDFENAAFADTLLADPVGRGRGALWADFDRNGRPELLIFNYQSAVRLLAWSPDRWRDVTQRLPVVPDFAYWRSAQTAPGAAERARSAWLHTALAADLDNDGWTDLLTTGRLGMCGLWRNHGDGSFQDATSVCELPPAFFPHAPIHAAAGDLDHDGRLDLVLLYRPDPTVRPRRHPVEVRRNDDGRYGCRFPAHDPVAAAAADLDPAAGLLADLDNDGHLDCYVVAHRRDETTPPNVLLQGLGDGGFVARSDQWGGGGPVGGNPESAWAVDLDRDGDLDLVTCNGGADDPGQTGGVVCYENRSTTQKGVTLELIPTAGAPHGLGARLRVRHGGLMQVREVQSVANPVNAAVLPVHFGLGEHAGPVEVVVDWPTSGGGFVRQQVTLPAAGAAYRLRQGSPAVRLTTR